MNTTRQIPLRTRFRLNAASHGYAQLITLLAQLVQVPFFLQHWGKAGYSDWLVLTGVPMMFMLLDLGVSQAAANKATVCAGANDWPGVRRTLQTAFVYTIALGLLLMGVAALASSFVEWVPMLKLTTISEREAHLIVLLMSVLLALTLIGGPIDGWFRAMDRSALGAFLIANRRLADIVTTIAVLLMGGNAVDLSIWLCVVHTILIAALLLTGVRLSSKPLLGWADASMQEFRSVMKPALSYASFPLAQVLTLQGGLQILNQVATPAVVVGYTMTRTLVRLIIQFGVVANNALKPEISRLAGRGDMAQAQAFTLATTRKIMLLCVAMYVAVVAVGPQIMTLWSHGAVSASRAEIAMIGVHTLLNVAWFIPAALLIAVNRHSRTAVVYGVASAAALLLWLALLHRIAPIVGAAMLLALPELCVLVLLYADARRQRPRTALASSGAVTATGMDAGGYEDLTPQATAPAIKSK